jgi:hypothetical protein
MKINHTIVHYVLIAAAMAVACTAYVHKPDIEMVPTTETHEVTHVRVSRFDWPVLGEKKTIDLGEAISKISPDKVQKVILFCANATCQNLRTDIDDAMQIAFWQSTFEDRPVDSEAEKGISVGPPGKKALALAKAIEKTTGIPVTIVPIDKPDGSPIDEIGVIIGKSEGR